MIRVIRKAISLTNSPLLSDEELFRRAEDWTEFLIEIIPEENLDESFQFAAKNNTSNFPVSAFEVKTAFEQLEKERQRLRDEHSRRRAVELDAERNTPFFEPCGMCFGSGFTEVARQCGGQNCKSVIRCYSCDYWERYKLKHNS